MDRRRHKPARIELKPGQKWATTDRQRTAIVTSIHQVTAPGRPELDLTIVSYLRSDAGDEATLAQAHLETFRANYPLLVDST